MYLFKRPQQQWVLLLVPAGTLLACLVFVCCSPSFWRMHAHRFPRTDPDLFKRAFKRWTEADFADFFGCPGKLAEGRRGAGEKTVVEWGDDESCYEVGFNSEGKCDDLALRYFDHRFYQGRPQISWLLHDKVVYGLRWLGFDAR